MYLKHKIILSIIILIVMFITANIIVYIESHTKPSNKNKMSEFLLPDNMKKLGFDCLSNKDGYLKYQNDGTKHYNKDYNSTYPEPKGKVIVYVNISRSNYNFVGIMQDGDTRTVYNGVCEDQEFLVKLLYSVR